MGPCSYYVCLLALICGAECATCARLKVGCVPSVHVAIIHAPSCYMGACTDVYVALRVRNVPPQMTDFGAAQLAQDAALQMAVSSETVTAGKEARWMSSGWSTTVHAHRSTHPEHMIGTTPLSQSA